MPFSNDILGGASNLIRRAIQSPGFLSGVSGWIIRKDGSAEFQSLQIGAGQVQAGALGPGAVTAGTIAAGALDAQTLNAVTINGDTITASAISIAGNIGKFIVYGQGTQIQTLRSAASGTYVAPAAGTLTAELWGAGAGGGGNGGAQFLISGGAGGGGQYVKYVLAVTNGQNIPYVVGAKGTGGSGVGVDGTNGGATTLNGGSQSAAGGIHGQSGNTGAGGGAGGTAAPPGSPTDTENGGGGGNGVSGGPAGGGGGGGSGGPGNPGNRGGNGRAPPNSGFGAGASAVPGGGPGGRGGGANLSPFNGQPPSAGPGGGGGGAGGDGGGSRAGGNGWDGQIRFTFVPSASTLVAVIAGLAGNDSVTGENYPVGIEVDGILAPIVARDPVNGGPETWHNITLDSGWTQTAGQQVCAYRLMPDGQVAFKGSATHASFTATTSVNGTTPLPTQYRPASTLEYCKGADGNRAGFGYRNTGILSAFPLSTGSTAVELNGIANLT